MIDRAPEIWVANFGFVYVYASLTKLFLAFLMIFRVEHVKQGQNETWKNHQNGTNSRQNLEL